MTKRFYKHKVLLDEHVWPRQRFPHLNALFDVKHIKHDLRHAGLDDVLIYTLARQDDRIILTSNVKDFRPLVQPVSPGIISIPETWTASRLDTKLTALLTRYGPKFFRGRVIALAGEEVMAP